MAHTTPSSARGCVPLAPTAMPRFGSSSRAGSPRRGRSSGSHTPGGRRRSRRSEAGLVGPPAAPALDVLARILAEAGRTEDEDLEALRAALVAAPRSGRDADHVPFHDLDDLVVELHPPAPAHDHVHLLLLLVRVAEW